MALIKTFNLDTGVDASYWKVIDAHYDYINKSCSFRLGGWLDKKARKDGKRYITERSYYAQFKPPQSDLRDAIYTWLKTPEVIEGNAMVAEFSDATDDPEKVEEAPSS